MFYKVRFWATAFVVAFIGWMLLRFVLGLFRLA
ncbi:hypothetical protein FHS85_004647 [Rhodoligotrophos appendicifer]